MKYLVLICCLAGLLSGCNLTDSPKPPNLLDKSKMVAVLVDIHVAEALAEGKSFPDRDSTQAAFNQLQAEIFRKHQVTDTVFRQSYTYYLEHLKELDQIYEAVIDTLSLREIKARLQEARLNEVIMERESRMARARLGEQVYKPKPFSLQAEIYKHLDYDEKDIPYAY